MPGTQPPVNMLTVILSVKRGQPSVLFHKDNNGISKRAAVSQQFYKISTAQHSYSTLKKLIIGHSRDFLEFSHVQGKAIFTSRPLAYALTQKNKSGTHQGYS